MALAAGRRRAPPVGVKVPANQRFVLPNGLTIVLVPKKDVPLIAFSGFVRGGALADPADKPGVASLVAGLLDRGAGKRSAFEFADAVEGVGGSFNAGAGAESDFGRRPVPGARSRADDRAAGGRADAPAFRRGTSSRATAIARSSSSSRPRIPILHSSSASTAAPRCSAQHPFGRPQGGSERTLAALTQSDVVSYHAANFGADRATLVFAGDLDPEVDAAGADHGIRRLGESRRRAAVGSSPRRASPARRVLLVDSPGSVQTYFWLGNVGRRSALQRPSGARPR